MWLFFWENTAASAWIPAAVSCSQASPLRPHVLILITTSAHNYSDNDIWCLKSTFNIFHSPVGIFFKAHMFFVSHGLFHIHTATSHSFIHTWLIRPELHSWLLGRWGGWDAPLWWLLGERMTLICLFALLFLCITSKAWNNSTTESADTCLQVPAPAEINEINTSAPVQFLCPLCRPQVHITTQLYGGRTDYEADLLKVRYWQSADTVSH